MKVSACNRYGVTFNRIPSAHGWRAMMNFKGVIPALVTPLDENERVKVDVLRDLIEYLIGKGADGFYVGGATGEGINLRIEERERLCEHAVAAVDGRVPVIVQVAAGNIYDVIRLAKHAEASGANSVSATAPLFFKYTEEDIYNYYKAISDAVHVPVMIYYNPNAGFNFTADFVARMFREIENVTAIKWTSSSYHEMIRLKDLTNGEMNIINGPDEMLLMGLMAGADGGIGTTYNIIFDKIKDIYTSFRLGDLQGAQNAQKRADRIIHSLVKNATIPATKAVLERMGFAVGNATFPMRRYTESEKDIIFSDLLKAGLKT